jgi:GNAT superfamily N-acetyltransferase
MCVSREDSEFEKEAWCTEVSFTDGACGKVATIDDRPIGYALFGAPESFAGARVFPAKVSKDALLLAVAYVLPDAAGWGVGKALVQAILVEAKKRGKRAVEAFGDRSWEHPACVIPASFLEVVGFRVKREHPRFPLMRIDVRSLAKLSENVEAAVAELLESLKVREPAAQLR